MIKNILLPNLGEGVETADVSEVLVKPGDQVAEDTPILVLESEKATMEIPAERAGMIKEIFVENGEQISTGQKLMSIEIGGTDKGETTIEAKPKVEKEKLEEPKPVEKKAEATPEPKKQTQPTRLLTAPWTDCLPPLKLTGRTRTRTSGEVVSSPTSDGRTTGSISSEKTEPWPSPGTFGMPGNRRRRC